MALADGWRFRPTWAASVAAAAALAVLLGLGFWQLARMDEKAVVIAERAALLEGPPLAVDAAYADPKAAAGQRIRLEGRFLHERELHLIGRSFEGMSGLHVMAPLVMADGRVVLVNRGWVPFSRRNRNQRPEDEAAGDVVVEGVVRLGGWGGRDYAKPDNLPAENHWVYVDLAEMAAAAGLSTAAPFYVEAAPAGPPGTLPVGIPPQVRIHNDHLGYAITWFSLAAALVAIYILFHLRRPEDP